MKVELKRISSVADGLETLYMSKRSFNEEIREKIARWDVEFFDRYGRMLIKPENPDYEEFMKAVNSLFKWGQKHITMLRYIDISAL